MVTYMGMWVPTLPASVAQGIEQRFPVPRVGGSNPLGCACVPVICEVIVIWQINLKKQCQKTIDILLLEVCSLSS